MDAVEKRMRKIAQEKQMQTSTEVEDENIAKIEKATPHTTKKLMKGPNFLYQLLHKHIIVVLTDGETLDGNLNSFNNYEINMTTPEIKELIIQKHAIKYFYQKGDETD